MNEVHSAVISLDVIDASSLQLATARLAVSVTDIDLHSGFLTVSCGLFTPLMTHTCLHMCVSIMVMNT